MSAPLVLNPPQLQSTNELTRLFASIDNLGDIYFEVPARFAHMLDEECGDPFVAPLVWIAMEKGLDLEVRASVSAKLAKSVIEELVPLFRYLQPTFPDISIRFHHLRSDWVKEAHHSMTAFSGGVDSWFSAIEAIESHTPYDYFVYNSTGQHGTNDPQTVAHARWALIEASCAKLNTPVIFVDSNLDSFIEASFLESHTVRNTSVGLLFQKYVGQFIYSSGYSIDEIPLEGQQNLTMKDPFILRAMSTERCAPLGVGEHHNRTEKLRRISNSPYFDNFIYVCVEKTLPIRNCGVCFKCRRTLVCLENLQLDAVIRRSFDIDQYHRQRKALIIGLLTSAQSSILDNTIARDFYAKHPRTAWLYKLSASIFRRIKRITPTGIKWRMLKDFPHVWG